MKKLQVLISILLLIQLNFVYNYSYDKHGSDWVGTCATGMKQSPINIESYELNDEPTCLNVNFQFLGEKSTITTNNGHTLVTAGQFLQIDYKEGNKIKSSYKTLQFHFHSKSEHTLDGELYDLELHIVTQNVIKIPKKLAVFGIFFSITENEDEETHFFKKYQFPEHEEENSNSGDYEIDFAAIFNLVFRNQNKLFTYQGSLTTPTCDEIVSWHVFKKPLKITKETLEKFQELWFKNGEIKDGNNRVTVPLNGRHVEYAKFCHSIHLIFTYILFIFFYFNVVF